jgi:hypothetical protein
MRDVEVRQHGAFGPTGGAGGVEDDRHVLLAGAMGLRGRDPLGEQHRKRGVTGRRRAHGHASVSSSALRKAVSEFGLVDQ